MASNTLDHVAQKGHVQKNRPKKFQKKLLQVCLKSIAFCRRGLTHLNATPTLENRSETYGSPCTVRTVNDVIILLPN